jgi:putative membrane protein
MFIDYITLMLINMSAGYVLLFFFVIRDLNDGDRRRWVPGLMIAGLIAFLCGLRMTWSWPLPGSYNIAYGEMSVLLGALFLGAALCFAMRWDPISLAIYAFFPGIAAILIGVRIIGLGLTNAPLLSGLGFICSGIPGVLIGVAIYYRNRLAPRLIVAVLLLAAALIWACIGYRAYWGHLAGFKDYTPPVVQRG